MKAVDPTIKVGAVLTIPGSWPDGVVAAGDPADWNHTGGTWTSEGQDVRVVPGKQISTIPAGGSVAVGFVGANEGAYPSPTVFRLNGTVCSTL